MIVGGQTEVHASTIIDYHGLFDLGFRAVYITGLHSSAGLHAV